MIRLGFITSTKKYHYVSSKLQRKTVCSKIYFILESGKSTKRNGNVNIKTKTVSVAAAVVVSGTTVRPYVAATFLLKLSLCFLSGPTVLWNLIWKHRLLPLSLLLFYYIMIVWPPMLNKKQVWRNANQDTRWWWAFLAYCKYRWEASDNCEMSRGAS